MGGNTASCSNLSIAFPTYIILKNEHLLILECQPASGRPFRLVDCEAKRAFLCCRFLGKSRPELQVNKIYAGSCTTPHPHHLVPSFLTPNPHATTLSCHQVQQAECDCRTACCPRLRYAHLAWILSGTPPPNLFAYP